MKKVLKVFGLIAFVCVLLTGCGSKTIPVNETVDIERDSVKMTVLGSEDVSVTDSTVDWENRDYTKVKMKIENYGTEEFNFSINFMLGEEAQTIYAAGFDDAIESVIPAGETATGYLYFEKTSAKTLVYTSTNINADKKGNIVTEQFRFNIK